MPYTGTSIVDYLKSIKADSSMTARAKRATTLGIPNYTGTAEQNTTMLDMLRSPTAPATPITPIKGETPDLTGLTGLRSAAEGQGLGVDWARETGPTINNVPVSTAGLQMQNDTWYGTPTQINTLLSPFAQTDLSGLNNAQTEGQPPAYTGQYDTQTAAILEKYLNREPYAYDMASDPAYQSYKQAYQREGERAFQDVIGNLSAPTGGRPSSWATSAAAQAKNLYSQKLMDVVPQLEQQAYGREQDKYANLANQLGMLQNIGATEYGQHRDTVGDWQTQRSYDYGVSRDNIMDERYMQQFDYDKQQDIIRNAQQNRQISVQEANAALNRVNSEYERAEAEKAGKPLAERYTPQQTNYYKNAYDYLTNKDPETAGNAEAALAKAMRPAEKLAYENSMGADLYKNLITDLQNAVALTPEAEAPDVLGGLYSDMMTADDPAAWLATNAYWIGKPELIQLEKMIPSGNDALKEILEKLILGDAQK